MTTTNAQSPNPAVADHDAPGGTFPTGIRRVLGPLATPAMLLCLLATGPLDPFPDDLAAPSEQLTHLAGRTGDVQLMSLFEIVAAVLMAGIVLFYVGGTRERGRGVANAGAVFGSLGVVGLSFIGVHHLLMVAVAGQPMSVGAAVLDALDTAAGPGVLVLFFATPVALLLFAIAGFRAGFVPLPALALMVLFFIGELVPGLPRGELFPLVVAFVASLWIAVTVLRTPRRGAVAA